MKMEKALEIINGRPAGYLVHFEHAGDGFLRSDYFPDVHAGEPPIATEQDAWDLARRFAAKTPRRCVNLYVVHSLDFTPVPHYREQMLVNR